MIYKIFNDNISVEISDLGAELQSIKYQNIKYLWQGDKTFWGGRAYNLFPICGRLTDGKYTYKGNTYEMNLHGFLRKSVLTATKISDSEIDFCMVANENSLAIYPFNFEYHILYKLIDTKIEMKIEVKNLDKKDMYFALGGHPGFNVPLVDDNFEDYYLEFTKDSKPIGIYLTDTCYTTDDTYEIKELKGNSLPLTHNLFDRDAQFMQGITAPVVLKSNKHNHEITLDFPSDMQYVGIWHAPKTTAPYICIEPWTSLPAYDSVVDDLETKRDMFRLAENEVKSLTWSISIK